MFYRNKQITLSRKSGVVCCSSLAVVHYSLPGLINKWQICLYCLEDLGLLVLMLCSCYHYGSYTPTLRVSANKPTLIPRSLFGPPGLYDGI